MLLNPSIFFIGSAINLFFCAAFAEPGLKTDFGQSVTKLATENPKIIIIGEDHNNAGLASGINDFLMALRKHQNFNCLFLELPNDIQNKLNDAMSVKDLSAFSTAVTKSKKSAYLSAFKKMGISAEQLESVEASYNSHLNDPLPNFPFNIETMNILNHESISLIGDDQQSEGQETLNTVYFSILDQYYGRDRLRDIESMKNSNIRSKIMSQNIDTQFRLKNCDRALVVVGYAHLYSNEFFKLHYNSDLSLKPIQDLLRQNGYSVRVVVADHAEAPQATTLILNQDKQDRFHYFSGHLISH